MKLDEVNSDVKNQLDQQASLGVQIQNVDDVPEEGPTNKGQWHRISNVTAIFADIKDSTQLNIESSKDAAYAYTYFIKAMTVILERFDARYIDIQGDGIFGLFSGSSSSFDAIACAVTMKTAAATIVTDYFNEDASTDWQLSVGFGIDRGTLLVRRLGLRGTKQNEVWAGKPVNVAAKLSGLANGDQLLVPGRVFNLYEKASAIRRRALLWTCGCRGNPGDGPGLDADEGTTETLWTAHFSPKNLKLDFDRYHTLKSQWCEFHGPEYCEAILTGRRP